MFWKMRMQAPSALDDLLASETCTLEEVLDEENVVDELRSNRALLDFLTRHDILNELISLVIEEPPDDIEESIRFKRPHVACNLFSMDSAVNALADSVAADESLLDKLWSFLEQPAPLNPLLASFFSRVVLSLLQRKAVTMVEYMSSRDGALEQLLRHIDTSAVMDLILGIVTACDSPPLRRDMIQWFHDAQLVRSLVDMVHPSASEDKQRNAARTLSELVRLCYEHLSRSSDVLQSDQLLDILEHDDTIQQLLNNALAAEGGDCGTAVSVSPIVRSVSVLQSMLMLQLGTTDMGSMETPVVANEEAARQVVASLTPWLPAFHRLLLEPPSSQPIRTPAGAVEVPVGAARLGIVQLLLLCLRSNIDEFLQEFVRLNIAHTLLDLFFQYEWNNFLHTQVEQLVVFAFSASSRGTEATASATTSTTSMSAATEESTSTEETPAGGAAATQGNALSLDLLSSYQLTERLGRVGVENDSEQSVRGGRRRGYMGHIVSMCNTITSAMESNEQIATAVRTACEQQEGGDGDSSSSHSFWTQWVAGGLATSNERNNALLGGQQMVDDEPDDLLTGDASNSTTDTIHQAFLNYQSEQLSTEFADSFGFDEEELGFNEPPVSTPYDEAAALDFELSTELQTAEEDQFEACCEARIKQYGEVPVWDDEWAALNKESSAARTTGDAQLDNDIEGTSSNQQQSMDMDIAVTESPNVSDLDDTVLMDDDDDDDDGEIDEEAVENFQFLTGGLMSKKSVEVSDIRADAEAAMKEFEEVTGIAQS